MKKIIVFLGLMLLAGGLLGACSVKKINVGAMSKDFTNLELTDQTTGKVVLLDENNSKELYEQIKGLEFSKAAGDKADQEAGITVRFLKASKEINRFIIMDESTIEYQGGIYTSDTDGFDMKELASLFVQQFKAVVIEGGDRLLVAPEEGSSAFASSDRISVGLVGAELVDEKGKVMTADQFKPGDLLRISYDGTIRESYPAQISALRIEYLGPELKLGGFMAVIDDIYREDSALNDSIKMIAFDTGEWGLTEIEKEIILAWAKEEYGYDTLQASFEELAEQGLIDKKNLYFPEGILIELKNVEWNEQDSTLKCSVSKWRSGLGAIGADVEATFDGGSWKLTKSKMWIS